MDKEQIASIIGEKIKQYRLKNGWTQQELGSRIGISKNAIGNYEKGIRSPKKDTMFDLASAFKISIDDLFPQIKKDSSTANPLPNAPDLLTQQINDTVVQLTTHNKKIVLRTSEELLESQEREVNEELFEYPQGQDTVTQKIATMILSILTRTSPTTSLAGSMATPWSQTSQTDPSPSSRIQAGTMTVPFMP